MRSSVTTVALGATAIAHRGTQTCPARTSTATSIRGNLGVATLAVRALTAGATVRAVGPTEAEIRATVALNAADAGRFDAVYRATTTT